MRATSNFHNFPATMWNFRLSAIVAALVISVAAFPTASANVMSERLETYGCLHSTLQMWSMDELHPELRYEDMEARWLFPICEAVASEAVKTDDFFSGGLILPDLITILENKNLAVRSSHAIHALRLIRDGGDVDAYVDNLNEQLMEQLLYDTATQDDSGFLDRMSGFSTFSYLFIHVLKDQEWWVHPVVVTALEIVGESSQ